MYQKDTNPATLMGGCADTQGCSLAEIRTMLDRIGLRSAAIELRLADMPRLTVPAIVLARAPECPVGHFRLVVSKDNRTIVYVDTTARVQTVNPADLSATQQQELLPALLVADYHDRLDRAIAVIDNTPPKKPSHERLLAGMTLLGAFLISIAVLKASAKTRASASVSPRPVYLTPSAGTRAERSD